MKKSTLAFLLAASLPLAGNAQRYLGIATGNYSGTNSLYLNPANLGDSRHRFTIDLFSMNFGVDNNLGTINSSNIFSSVGSDKMSDILSMKTNKDKFSMLLPYAEVRLPGFMININDKHGIALTTRIRAFNQINDISRQLFQSVEGTANTESFKADAFNWTAHTWSEIGLSYGGVIYEQQEHMIKGGISARYLMGAGYVNMKSKNIDVDYNSDNNMVSVRNTDLQFSSNFGDPDEGFVNGADILNNFFGGGGNGFGMDLGVVYEFRPNYQQHTYDMDGKTGLIDRSRPSYALRFSAAVTDIGGMKYKKNVNTLLLSNSGTAATFNANDLRDSVTDYNSLRTFAGNHGITVQSQTDATSVGLPSALVLGLDYNIANVKSLYANLTFIGNLVNRTARVGNNYYGQLTLTPRYETPTFSVGLPLTYNFLNNSMKMGLGVRLAGFFVGSDDMLAFFSNNHYGANFYLGAYVPFNKRKTKDSDGDLISNKRDKCPNEKGVLEMAGCPNPDKDGDGILDKDDKCPDVAGAKTAMGCPDADLDSLADAQDRCPNEAGLVTLQGCPDRDGDEIVDLDDLCPDVKGLAAFKGCPDTDGDGIPDNTDACPEAAGPTANNGCPDTDNDGIADNEDKCPTVPGTRANRGCPEISVEVKKRLAFAATAIQFETGKAVIKPASFKLLDEIVQILNDYPDYYMTIDGHTDDVGKDDFNMQLSKDRANSVKNYFVGKGISESRLVTNGYGETMPVASNKTKAGKAKNRRVAMDLKLRD